MSNDNTAPLIGRTLAHKYTIENVVGTGAMGTIYRARQIALDKYVAVKVLHAALAQDPSFVDRFKLEAFSASRLEHPNSLRVLDFGKDDELLYLVMEYVEADNLLSIMERSWPFDDQRVAQITSQTLAALAKAHDVGIVHRDLKPENILVLEGTDDEGNPIDIVKVCDFGIAKLATPIDDSHPFAPHNTHEGVIVGTPDYMSPEQAKGEDVDARSDLYSMGVVLYHLLTGKTPFDADTPLGIAVQHVSQEPVRPSALRKVHPELEEVCLRAMSKRVEDRYQSAREMRRAVLSAVGSGTTTNVSLAGPLPIPLPPPVPRPIPVPSAAQIARKPTPKPSPSSGVPRVSARPRFATSTAPGELDISDVEEIDETPTPLETNPFAPRRRGSLVAVALLGVATVAASAVIVQRPSSREVHSTTVALAPSPETNGPALGATQSVTATPVANQVAPSVNVPAAIEETRRPTAARATDQRGARRPTGPAPAKRSEPAAPTAAPLAAVTAEPEPAAPAVEAPAPPPPVETVAPAPPAPAPRAQVPAEPTPTATAVTVDPSRASVTIGAITTSSGISITKVKTAAAHAPFAACYKTALGQRTSGAPLQSALKIDIDLSGHVVGASLSDDGNLPGLRSCVESAARGIKVRDVDTGDGSATINLTFSPQ